MSRILPIKVKPRARLSELTQTQEGQWLAQLKSEPVDGKANEELIALVADHWGCRQAEVSMKSGTTSRMKLVRVETLA